MRHLPLTFPRDTYKGRSISIGCANGIHVRYEVRKVMTGDWQLTIGIAGESLSREASHQFGSERKAKDFARADFRRRQIVRLAG